MWYLKAIGILIVVLLMTQISYAQEPLNAPSRQNDPNPTEPPEADYFLEFEIDNLNPYVGEQVVYTLRLFTSFRVVSQIDFDFPRFAGFAIEDQQVTTTRTHRVEGRRYNVQETKILLFPTRDGEITIDETILTYPDSVLYPDFFLATEPLTLNVKPLPDGAPDGFDNAVGLFTIEAETSLTESVVDEPITLLVTLIGRGNMTNAPDPIWPELQEWRVFDAQSNTTTEFQNGDLFGRRVYERLIVPGSVGDFTYPPIEYHYFDPGEGEYRTISTEPIEINVILASTDSAELVVVGGNKEEIERIGADIRYIKSVPEALNPPATALTSENGYWFAWAIPVLLFVANAFWSRRERFLRRNIAFARSARAFKQASSALAAARGNQQDPYVSAGQILTVYLSDKLNRAVVGLTQNALVAALEARQIGPNLIERVQTSLTEADMGRFAPGSHTPERANQILDDVEALIADLEEAFA